MAASRGHLRTRRNMHFPDRSGYNSTESPTGILRSWCIAIKEYCRTITRAFKAFAEVDCQAEPDLAPATSAPSARYNRQTLIVAAVLTFAVALGAFGLWSRASREVLTSLLSQFAVRGPLRSDARASIAILPFVSLAADSLAANDYFSDGLTEDIIAALGRFRDPLSDFSWWRVRVQRKAAQACGGRALDLNVISGRGSVRHTSGPYPRRRKLDGYCSWRGALVAEYERRSEGRLFSSRSDYQDESPARSRYRGGRSLELARSAA